MPPGKRAAARQAHKDALGSHAETLAAEHLERLGFAIVDRNVRVGRLEIDIVARRGELVVFCEVRARTDDRWVAPHQTIDRRKIGRIRAGAAGWLREHSPAGPVSIRLDVASVVIAEGHDARVDYFEGAL